MRTFAGFSGSRLSLFRVSRFAYSPVSHFFLICLFAFGAAAQALELPPALSAWQGWVLDKHPEATCTRVAADLAQRRCVWPGRLTLAVSEKGGSFSQSLTLEAAGWVYLPGDRDNWPQSMTLNGRTASALNKDQQPALYLEAGEYVLRGNFDWSAMPQSLAIPAAIALFDLNVNGKPVTNPNLEGSRLWLRVQNDGADSGAHNSVKVEVFRKIEDELPRTLETVLRLSVSGKARELKLGRFLLKDAEPLGFVSPLPARIEDDGSLRVQARAGEWEIRMKARLLGDTNQFAIERQSEDWPTQEVWSFAANQSLRRVKVDGAPSVDPSQLDLPADFDGDLPTFLLEAETTLTLEQLYRGDATPAPNELALQRTVWVDFDGKGATIKDHITGALTQDWRLDTQPAIHLGRVQVNGEPQVVTQLQKQGASGVEIREPQVNVDAVSRVDQLDALNAAGWQTDFNGVQMQLQLPPGWKLWHASGPDQVDDSWVSRWNLWAIFLSLLIIGAIFRLLDWRWALVAAATVALVYHENLALIILMLPLLVAIALLNVIHADGPRLWIQRVGYAFGALLVLVILTFAVDQIRRGIYPQLELPYSIADSAQNPYASRSAPEQEEDAVAAAPAPAMAMQKADSSLEEVRVSAAVREAKRRYQPSNNVQTGPGEPKWSWQPVSLSWSGPVKADQPLHLYLTGTWLTRLLKFFNVLLVVALAGGILRALVQTRPNSHTPLVSGSGGTAAAVALVLIAALGVLTPTAVHADDFPPKTLLDELQKRLLRDPACAPNCAATEAAFLQIADGQLSVKLRVVVAADLAIALPGASNWQPRSVLVDGLQSNTAARAADGTALLPLNKGNHELVLEGPIGSDDITLQFADRPHSVKVIADDWDVFGLNGNRLAANSVQLQKRQRTAQQDTLLPVPAQPFVRVVRHLDLDLDWSVTTTVERVAPEQGAINVTLPLLTGESIVSGNIEAKEGAVTVSLGSQDRSFTWTSTLSPTAKLTLSAAASQHWVETWQVLASPRWHVAGDGLIAVKGDGSAERQWRPWPGETLTLLAQQPIAIKGPTTTVESAKLALTPGKRSSALEAQLQISSSVGGDYRLALREPNELKSVSVNGVDISQSRADEKLVLPLTPGTNAVVIRWELARGADFVTRTPALALDTIGNNVDLTLQFPGDRWPLWVSGPHIGPAMLYWGVLVVIIGVAVLLGAITQRLKLSIPLRTWQWLLLFIGMSTVNTVGSVAVLLWFFALEVRHRFAQKPGGLPQNDVYYLIQIGIVLLSVIAAIALAAIIPQSLLSTPDMQVTGNGSHNYFFNWYQDRSTEVLPQAQVSSVPLWWYRVAMLAWSLWLVFALLNWVKWGWAIFAEGGVWPKRPDTAIAPATAQVLVEPQISPEQDRP